MLASPTHAVVFPLPVHTACDTVAVLPVHAWAYRAQSSVFMCHHAVASCVPVCPFPFPQGRVRDGADQFVPGPGMTRDALEGTAARLRAAEGRREDRRRVMDDGTGTRAARKRAYAEGEAATRIQVTGAVCGCA